MTNKSELEIVREFEKHFDRLRYKKFILYGIGVQTKILLENLPGFVIDGLMDNNPNNIGRQVCGRKILSIEEAAARAKDSILVIISKEENQEPIYNDLRPLAAEHGLEVYFQNGMLAKGSEGRASIDDNPYWNEDASGLTAAIDAHDVVSFDLFDTLISRETVKPLDIFAIVERAVTDSFAQSFEFAAVRVLAETECIRETPYRYTLDDIYAKLKALSAIPDESLEQIKKKEILTELEHIVPRTIMVSLHNHAIQQGKTVNIISDMYLPSTVIDAMLRKCGIAGYNRLFLSCECNAAKGDGTLWEYYAEFYAGKKCLHIGDSLESDIAEPTRRSISSYRVMSPREMLRSSSIRNMTSSIKTTEDTVMAGLVCNRLFNNPFALCKTKGQIHVDDLYDLGYVFFGPLVFSYLAWLISRTLAIGVDKILFCAREGYLLHRLYQKIADSLNVRNAPRAIYFKTSRRMIIGASLKGEEDIFDSLKIIRFFGPFKDFMLNRFGIHIRPNDEQAGVLVNTRDDRGMIRALLRPYVDQILENAATERRNYIGYLRSICDPDQEHIVLSEAGLYGTVQYYLSKILERPVAGYYFCALMGGENPYGLTNNHGLYSGNSSYLANNLCLFESVITAPEGMYVRCNSDGSFCNAPLQSNQRSFDKKELIHQGIVAFAKTMVERDKLVVQRPRSLEFADNLWGTLTSHECVVSEEIRETFYYDNYFTRTTENKIAF